MSQLSCLIVRAAICAIVVAGCRGTSPDPPEGCSGPIDVAVLSDVPPRFSWSPHCGISFLTVSAVAEAPGATEEPVWGFHLPEASPVGPTVAYGAAPSRATVWTGPEGLVIGRRYRVFLGYTVGGDVLAGSGALTFTWFPPD